MRRWPAMRLKHKLIASYLVALLVPILIITITLYNLTANSLEQSSRQFASMYTSQARTTIDDFMMEYDQLTKSVLVESDIIRLLESQDPISMEQRIENKERIHRFLNRLVTLKPEIDAVMLIGSNQEVYPYSRASIMIDERTLLTQTWLEDLQDQKENLFITPVHDRSYYMDHAEGAVVTVGRKILNYSGSYAGIILMDLKPQELIKLNEDFLLARNQYDIRLVMSKQNGELIYHSDATIGRRQWTDIIGDKHIVENQMDNDDLIVLTESSTLGGILLSTEIPMDHLLANIKRIRNVTLYSAFGCIAFVVIVSIIFSHRMTRPIIFLRRSMKMAEAGHYVPISNEVSSKDEIGGLVDSYNKMILRIKALIEDVFIAEIKQKQAKFLALQTQINPHMLYNTLEQIRMKALVKNQDEIADMIKILARLFKLSLGKERGSHTIGHEIDYVTNYIKLQNIRYEDCFELEVNMAHDMMNTPILPVVLQPIVENSIQHGFRDHRTRLTIGIEGEWIGEEQIVIRISDNGATMSSDKARQLNEKLQLVNMEKRGVRELRARDDAEGGIGLVNIAERIKLHYGEEYGLKIIPRERSGVTVEIHIPDYDGYQTR